MSRKQQTEEWKDKDGDKEEVLVNVGGRYPAARRHVGRVRLETTLPFPQKTRAVMVVAHAVKYLLPGVGVPCTHICD